MTIQQVQHLLIFLGYDTGGPDGIFGKKTRLSVRDFQAEYGGLEVDARPGPQTEAALRKAVGNSWQRPGQAAAIFSPGAKNFWDEIRYFSREEFRCTCGGRFCNGFPVEPEERLVRTLDAIREKAGLPFTPNSAIRCPERNREVGGERCSQHLYGTAADISVPGMSPQMAAVFAETLLPGTGGIGIYPWGIHVDTREEKARWKG